MQVDIVGEFKELDADHIIATWQSLQYNMEIMRRFNAVIVDEAHGAKATVIQKLLVEYGGHIAYRYAVTGTFPLPKTEQMTLLTSIGKIVDEVPTSYLIEHGFLSTININMWETQESADLPDYEAEMKYLAKNEDRIEFIAGKIKELHELHGNTLVLVKNIPFGRKLAKKLNDAIFLSGTSSGADRSAEYSQFDTGDDILVIASQGIASTGISIDRIFCLIVIDYGKSFIKAIQTCGRGLRKGGDKSHIEMYDIYSSLPSSKKHVKDRVKYYKKALYPVSKAVKFKY